MQSAQTYEPRRLRFDKAWRWSASHEGPLIMGFRWIVAAGRRSVQLVKDGSEFIDRAPDATALFVHRRDDVHMAKKLLGRADGVTRFEEMRAEGMPECVTAVHSYARDNRCRCSHSADGPPPTPVCPVSQ